MAFIKLGCPPKNCDGRLTVKTSTTQSQKAKSFIVLCIQTFCKNPVFFPLKIIDEDINILAATEENVYTDLCLRNIIFSKSMKN